MEFIVFTLSFSAAIINGYEAAREGIPIWLRIVNLFFFSITAIISILILVNFLL
jgi:hypothetical protein